MVNSLASAHSADKWPPQRLEANSNDRESTTLLRENRVPQGKSLPQKAHTTGRGRKIMNKDGEPQLTHATGQRACHKASVGTGTATRIRKQAAENRIQPVQKPHMTQRLGKVTRRIHRTKKLQMAQPLGQPGNLTEARSSKSTQVHTAKFKFEKETHLRTLEKQ